MYAQTPYERKLRTLLENRILATPHIHVLVKAHVFVQLKRFQRN